MDIYEISYALFITFISRRAYNSFNKDWHNVMLDDMERLKYSILKAVLRAQADKYIRETTNTDGQSIRHEICNGHESVGSITDITN